MLAQYRALPQSNLHRALRRARRAWWNSAARRTLTVAVTAASFAVVVVWLWSWLAGETGPVFASPSVSGRAGQAALTAFLGAFLVVAAWHGIRAPSLLELARRADHRQRHMQALSTAWEVIKAGGAHTVVARMLVSDAETRAESLDTSSGDNRLGVLRSAAVTGLALAAVAVFVPVPGRPTASTAAVAAGNGEAPLTEDQVATLEDVARLLDLSAEQSGDQYLRAIAASFAELATEATSGDLTRAGADRAVRDLLAHLGTAVSGSGGGLASAVEHALAQVPATAASGSPLAGADNASNGQLKTAQAEDAEAAVESATPDDSASLYMALRSLVDELEDGGGTSLRPTGPAAAGQTIDDSFYGGVGRAQADPNAAAPAGPLVRAEGAGDPAGAAQRSTEGAGDAAGAGAAALPEMFDPVAAVQAAAVAESLLPRNESTEGRRVEIEMVPQAEERPSDDEAPVLAPDFVRSREAAIVARGVGAEHGDVVGRYFTPDSSSGDGAP